MPFINLPAYGDAHFAAPVATTGDLPLTDPVNSVRLVTATYILYYFDGASWAAVNTGAVGGLTASRALVSSAGGLLTVATTTAAEIGYVNGVTSAIQTQLNAKEASITAGTTSQFWRGDKSFQTLNVDALVPYTDGSAGSTGEINEVLTASQATVVTTNVGATTAYGYVTSLSVTAGRWLAWGTVQFNENGATLTAGLQAGISDSTSGVGISDLETVLLNGLISSTSDAIASVPPRIISISSTTTYYLNTKFTYSAGTPRHAGKLTFLRIG